MNDLRVSSKRRLATLTFAPDIGRYLDLQLLCVSGARCSASRDSLAKAPACPPADISG